MFKNWILSIIIGAAALSACSASAVDGGTDGSTNWLRFCSTDADCPEELSCVCAACTIACSEDETCSAASGDLAPSCMPTTCDGAAIASQACTRDDSLDAETPGSSKKSTLLNGSAAPTELGANCIPGDEWSPDFPGFDVSEIVVSETDQCASGVCLVNAFQGRVTCPYGQSDDYSCLTPDNAQSVEVPVMAQLEARPASDAVYCSCRCDGPDPNAEYCDCGPDLECAPLINLELTSPDRYAGSYCTKPNTTLAPSEIALQPCDAATQSCPEAGAYAELVREAAQGVTLGETTRVFFQRLITPGDSKRCLPGPLPLSQVGASPVGAACIVFVAQADLECDAAGYRSTTVEHAQLVRSALESTGECEGVSCDDYAACELQQLLSNEALGDGCLTAEDPDGSGWCYLDPEAGLGSEELVSDCSSDARRKIRFIGDETPSPESMLFLGCVGQ